MARIAQSIIPSPSLRRTRFAVTVFFGATAFGIILFSIITPRVVVAHPYHFSVAELELNRETASLEVALRVFPEDLEKALRYHAERQSKKPVRLDAKEGVDERIVEYLKSAFVVVGRGAKKPASDIRWVGKELSAKEAWLYFEIPWQGDLYGARFENRVCFEHAERQINSVAIKDGTFRTTLWFTRKEPKRMLTAKPIKKERSSAQSKAR